MVLTLLDSWGNWRLPRARGVHTGVYLASAILAFTLGAGYASALIGALAAGAVAGVLEFWYRRRHPAREERD